jgi:hypothetical protein
MSFSDILKGIFSHAVSTPPAGSGEPASSTAAPAAPTTVGSVLSAAAGAAATLAGGDVMKTLSDLASRNPENLDWKNSIVDLLKLVGHDSSHAAREKLADELGYSGDKSDSAAMNEWLLGRVMDEIKKSGGKLPENL